MEIYILFVSLLLSAFFSGIEIAFVSANKLKLELKKKKGGVVGKILTQIGSDTSQFLGTTLIGNNIALVIYGLMMAAILDPLLVKWLPAIKDQAISILFLQTIISTLLVLVVGEFLPKVLFRVKPDATLGFFALPLIIVYYLLRPFTWSVILLSKGILKVFFKTELPDSIPVINKIDLENFVKERMANADQEEENEIDTELFEKVLYLNKVKLRECMVPRTEIVALDISSSLEELSKLFIESGLSKVIIYEESIDNIKGYVHNFELLNKPDDVASIVMDLPVVPETMPAKELLEKLKLERKTIAWVVDEFGGTAGIISMEDVLEEIFGEIEDEHDDKGLVMRKLSEKEYIFSGRAEIDLINEKFDLDLPKKEFETVAGWIFDEIENIPMANEIFNIGDITVTILSASRNKLDLVKLHFNH